MRLMGFMAWIPFGLSLVCTGIFGADFNYYLDMSSGLWYVAPAKGTVKKLFNVIAGTMIAEQTEELKKKLHADINDELKSSEFYGCFYSSANIEFGPPITSNRFYNKDLCAWECANDYTNCETVRTLVGVFHRTGCICLCEVEDLMGAEEAPVKECSNAYELKESENEFNIIMAGPATPFRVTTVCKSETWGDGCEKRCHCKNRHCKRSTGACLSGPCMEHYSGPSCQVRDYCANIMCSNGGSCVVIPGRVGYRCDCPDQTYGRHCENFYDWAGHEVSDESFSNDWDFDVMVGDLMNVEFVANLNQAQMSYFDCLSYSDKMEEAKTLHFNETSSYHLDCVHKCRRLG